MFNSHVKLPEGIDSDDTIIITKLGILPSSTFQQDPKPLVVTLSKPRSGWRALGPEATASSSSGAVLEC